MPPIAPRSWLLTCTPAQDGAGLMTTWPFWLPGVPSALLWLAAHGFRRRTRVGVILSNLPSSAALLQAMPMAGLTTVLFNRRLHRSELVDQIHRAKVSALVLSPHLPWNERGMPPIHVLPEAFAVGYPGGNRDAPLPAAGRLRDQPGLVLYTSGTSGRAKAARLALRALQHAGAAAVERLDLHRSDTWLCCLPVDHIGGASIIYRAGMCGCSVLLMERFEPQAVNAALDAKSRPSRHHHGVTGASLVPTMLHRLVHDRSGSRFPKRLRILLTGGAPLSPTLATATALLGRPACPTYGLTEAASQVCTPHPGRIDTGSQSCGPPVTGMQVRIRTKTGRPCPRGEAGIIEVRGGSLFSGYEERGILRKRLPGWFSTGDVGSLDADGGLTVHARRTDVIISGGENVYPAQVEAQLERHPAIAEAGVFGIPDAEWGQLVAAVLVPRHQPLPKSVLETWLARSLSGFKRPRLWRWTRDLPRTATGKVQRQLLHTWHAHAPR